MSRQAKKYFTIAILTTLLGSNTVSAEFEEIIVTAQKREQSLQDVPISVQVVSGDELAIRNANEVAAMAQISPGFRFGDGSRDSDRTLLMRGIETQTLSHS